MSAQERVVIDPVCKMELNPEQARQLVVYDERTYQFCSIGCRAEFERHPEDYTTLAEPGR